MAALSIKRCFDYARVSTDDQARKEYSSCKVQHDQCIRLIKSRESDHWFSVRSLEDAGFSGSTTNRPGYQQLCNAVRNREVDIVVVHNTDRISRDVADYLWFLDFLKEHGVELVSVTQNLESKGAVGKFTNLMQAGIQQLERERTAERTADNMLERSRNGLWNGGNPPLGYVSVKKRLEIDEAEAEIVRSIFTMAAGGKSLQSIADWLNDSGHRTKVRLRLPHGETKPVPAGGRRFRSDHLTAIIRNPVYCGRIRWKSEEYQGVHATLVETHVWQEANRAIAPASAKERRCFRVPDKHHHLVKGAIYCASCGVSMVPHWSGKRNKANVPFRYYECIHHVRRESLNPECAGRLPVSELEGVVLSALNQLGRRPDLLKVTLTAAQSSGRSEGRRLRSEISKTETELKETADHVASIIAAIKGGKLKGLEEAFQEEAQLLANRKNNLLVQREQLITRAARWRRMNPDPAEIVRALENFSELVQRLVPPKRKELIQLLVSRIEVRRILGKAEKTSSDAQAFNIRFWCRLPPPETDGKIDRTFSRPVRSTKAGSSWQIDANFRLVREGRGYRASLSAPFDDEGGDRVVTTPEAGEVEKHPITQTQSWLEWLKKNPNRKAADVAREFKVTRATVSFGMRLTKLTCKIRQFLIDLTEPRAIHFFSRRKLMQIAQGSAKEQQRDFETLRANWAARKKPSMRRNR